MACHLGAALRGANVCKPNPLPRDWVIADRVRGDRATPGQMVQVRLDGVPATDSLGRIAHVRSIRINTAVKVAIDSSNDPVKYHDLYGAIQTLYLTSITGHEYWPGLDGRDIVDDAYFRFGRTLQFPSYGDGNAIEENAGEGDEVISLTLNAPLTAPIDYPWISPLDGLIPLAALQRRGRDALRFRLATSLPGNPVGVKIEGYQASPHDDSPEGLDIWLELVYLPAGAIVPDREWSIDSYTLEDTSGLLRHPDRTTEYAWIRYHSDDGDGGQTGHAMAAGHDGITLTVAGFTLQSGLTHREAEERTVMAVFDAKHGSLAGGGPDSEDLPLIGSDALNALCLLPFRSRANSAAGPVGYKFTKRTAKFTRFLHRTSKCYDAEAARQIVASANCEPCAVYGTNARGDMTVGKVDTDHPIVVLTKPKDLRINKPS